MRNTSGADVSEQSLILLIQRTGWMPPRWAAIRYLYNSPLGRYGARDCRTARNYGPEPGCSRGPQWHREQYTAQCSDQGGSSPYRGSQQRYGQGSPDYDIISALPTPKWREDYRYAGHSRARSGRDQPERVDCSIPGIRQRELPVRRLLAPHSTGLRNSTTRRCAP